MDAVDELTKGWGNSGEDQMYAGGDFLVPVAEGSRLEAIAGVTENVAVWLVRTNSVETVATNGFQVSGGDVQEIVWGADETEKCIEVDTSSIKEGETLELTLFYTNAVYSTSCIFGVAAPGNSVENPKAFEQDFDFGEWTIDYAKACEKVKNEPDSHLLVMFSGTLWCPYCMAMNDSLLSKKEFKDWAQSNKVALVLFDQGRSTNPASAEGQLAPRLVTPYCDPYKTGNNAVSGAAYCSRNSITVEQAEAYIDLVTKHTQGWLAPDADTNVVKRLGNPTLLLVNPNDDTVIARFDAYTAEKEGEQGVVYDLDENIERLDKFLSLAGDEKNNYPSTTSLSYQMSTTSTVSLCVSRSSQCFKIDAESGFIEFSLLPDEEKNVDMKVWSGGKILATGTGAVSLYVLSEHIQNGLVLEIKKTFAKDDPLESEVKFTGVWSEMPSENPYDGVAFETVVPLYDNGRDDCVVGMLTVSAKKSAKKMKMTAKYVCSKTTKTVSFSSQWSMQDDYGRIFAQDDYKTKELRLVLLSTGKLEAELVDPDYGNEPLLGNVVIKTMNYEDYSAVYTVALPVQGEDNADALASSGAGYLIINATSSDAKKKGKVKVEIVYPDGKSTSLTNAQLTPGEDGFANLLVFKRSSYNLISAPVRIRCHSVGAPSSRAVLVQDGHLAVWAHDNKKGFAFERVCGVYGSRYDAQWSLTEKCGSEKLETYFTHELLVDSEKYGAITGTTGDGISIAVTDKKFTKDKTVKNFSVTVYPKTGKVKGTAKVEFADGKTRSLSYKGIILADWYSCGCYEDDDVIPLHEDQRLPFVIGTATFSDKKGSRSIVRGIEFGFFVPNDSE
jgi:hypothetical protein